MMSDRLALGVAAGVWLASLLALCAAVLGLQAQAQPDRVDPAGAFRLSVQALDERRLALRFDLAPGYHLERERITLVMDPADAAQGELLLPPGTREFDAGQLRTREVYRQSVTLVYALPAAPAAAFLLQLAHQGCADPGPCRAGAMQTVWVAPPAAGEHRLAVRLITDEPLLPPEPPARLISPPPV